MQHTTVDAVFRAWTSETDSHVSKAWARKRVELYRSLPNSIRTANVRDLTREDVARWHLSRKHVPFHANRALSVLSSALNYAAANGWVERNVASGIKRYKEPKRYRHATRDELSRILKALEAFSDVNEQGVAFVLLLLYTGARPSELERARFSDVEDDHILLSKHKTDASGRPRLIQLSPTALAIVRSLRESQTSDEMFTAKRPRRLWDSVRASAGTDLRLSELRHTFATHALEAGLQLEQVSSLLGHSSVQTTRIYAHMTSTKRRSLAQTVDDALSRLR